MPNNLTSLTQQALDRRHEHAVRKLAKLIRPPRAGRAGKPPTLHRHWATIATVNADNTVDLIQDNGNVQEVTVLSGYTPQPGDTVLVDYLGTDPIVIGTPGPGSDVSGTVIMGGWNAAPPGYLACDGSLQQIASYPSLFNAIATNFGGDGVTTFGLPPFNNLNNMVVAADGVTTLIGSSGGSAAHTHGLSQAWAQVVTSDTNPTSAYWNRTASPAWNSLFALQAAATGIATQANSLATPLLGSTDAPSFGRPPWVALFFAIKT